MGAIMELISRLIISGLWALLSATVLTILIKQTPLHTIIGKKLDLQYPGCLTFIAIFTISLITGLIIL